MRKLGSKLLNLSALAGLAALAAIAIRPLMAAEEAAVIPPPAMDATPAAGVQTAVFAGGCFWGVQGVFQHTEGVLNAVSGYAGGDKKTAVYEVIGRGDTGHAEAVEIKYDPAKISYGKLLQIFFSVAHDPTQLNRQGPDTGTQYRSTIFVADADQKKVTEAYIAQLNAAKVFPRKIATTIESGKPFYPAENYHQDYATLHPTQPYIAINDLPKIASLKKIFPSLYRDKPKLVRDASASN